MSGIQPVAVYAMRVPPGDIMVPAVPEFAAMFRVTMAAIDPSADPELDDPEDKQPPRATLKLVRVPDHMFDDEDSDDEFDEDFLDALEDDEDDEDDEDEDDEEEDDEEVNGGPSEKKPKGLDLEAVLAAAAEAADEDEDMEDDDEDDEDDEEADEKAIAQLMQLMKASKRKGKGKAVEGEDEDDEEDDDEDEEDEDDEALDLDEVVICTLDPEKNYQQTLDFVVGEGEKVFFKVSGTHTVHLTGNYVIPQDDGSASLYDEEDDEDEDYDLSPDEDELDLLEDGDEESDLLDDLEDPRVLEVEDDEEVPKLVKDTGKGKNKRPAEDDDEDDEEANLDDIMAKSLKKDEAANGDETKKLSKAEKKRLKKLKKNDGEAVDTTTTEAKKESNGSEKKVQFAKNLEQGPTPSATPPAKAEKADKGKQAAAASASIGVKEVQGVTVDDRKIGSGPAAKKGNRLEMRYIGKLDDGKVFDSNKSGKPFSFKLGAGEVIKGWDLGLAGIQVGGERRLTIPAHLAYGSKALPGIPKNSRLTFDIKCLGVK